MPNSEDSYVRDLKSSEFQDYFFETNIFSLFILGISSLEVGPDGLEPSTHGLKVRCSTSWAIGPNVLYESNT